MQYNIMLAIVRDYIRNQPQHFKRKAEVAADERKIIDHIVIVTGSNHGVGWQTALELSKRGAHVIMACRDLKKTEDARELILKEVPEGKLEIIKLDLADSKTVHEFSEIMHRNVSHIDMLINNAGIYKFDRKRELTKDGFEQHIGVNHLNPLLLTLLLLDLLKASKHSRIVNLAASCFPLAELNPNNLNLEGVSVSKYVPYANSKLANILFTRELARRLGEDSNITVYALCPGMVLPVRPEDQGFFMRQWVKVAKYAFGLMDLKEGVLCTLHCALSKSLERESGKMYRLLDVWDVEINDELALKLWEKSEEIMKIKYRNPA